MHVRKLLIPTAALFAATLSSAAVASAAPVLATGQACYRVGDRVGIAGIGFAPVRAYQVTIDGRNFGISTTDAGGSFSTSLLPGGLGANVVQVIHTLTASDGANTSTAFFTVTRDAGARLLGGHGTVATFHARFQVWGFGQTIVAPPSLYPVPLPLPPPRRVYVHYIGPHKHLKMTRTLGEITGQCGYLKTGARRVFSFIPKRGKWMLQIDLHRHYSKHPRGPVARIKVRVA